MQSPAVSLHFDFRDAFNLAKSKSGPKDWIPWATRYRNSLVHRGRPIWWHEVYERETIIPSDGSIRSSQETHLERYPEWSEVESLINADSPILTEEANTTISGIYNSTIKLSETVCQELVSIWMQRRQTPNLILQPAHWQRPVNGTKFEGYQPKAHLGFGDRRIGPRLMKRMEAAAVYPEGARALWDNSPWFS